MRVSFVAPSVALEKVRRNYCFAVYCKHPYPPHPHRTDNRETIMRPIQLTTGAASPAPRLAIASGVIAIALAGAAFTFTLTAPGALAQEPAGPQVSPPPAVAPPPPPAPASPGEHITVPSGTRFSV